MAKNKREAARLKAKFESAHETLGALYGRLDSIGTLYRFSKHHWKLCSGRTTLIEFWTKNNGLVAWRFGKGEVCRGSKLDFATAISAMGAAR